MEDSTILREIAEFDIKAPINVTISFDEDFDETPIKKEIVSDEYQEEKAQETVVSAFFPVDGLKLQHEAKTPSTPEPDNLKDKLLNSDTRKRKTENFESCKQKQIKCVHGPSVENNCNKENFSATSISGTDRNTIPSNLRANSCGSEVNSSVSAKVVDPGLTNKVTENHPVAPPDLLGVDQSNKDKLQSAVSYLASLSEIMRLIMQGFTAHKQQRISLDKFQDIKKKYFNLAYQTLVAAILPKEKDGAYLHAFVNETLLRARKKCGPYYTHTYQDYANLLHEMLIWTKRSQEAVQCAKISQPPMTQKSVIVGPEINNSSVQDKLLVIDPKKNTAADKVCIFSSGPPERALSINVDSNLKRYFQNTFQGAFESTNVLNKANEHVVQVENNSTTTQHHNMALESLTKFVVKNTSSSTVHQRPPVIQPTATAQIQQRPAALLSDTQTYSSSKVSNDIILNHKKSPAPVLQSQLQKPPLFGYLQQQIEPQPTLPSYDQSLRFQRSSKQQQTPRPYDQSQRLQSLQQQQTPSQYHRRRLLQSQLDATQFTQVPHLPQYNQTMQPQLRLSQQGQCHQQVEQCPTEIWPTLEEVLAMEQLIQQSTNESNTSPEPLQSRQPQQGQLAQTYGTEWHQGQAFQGPAPPQIQKGSPRSASTDSGFISPLNFNVPTDQIRSAEQTMPTTPQESEATLPMIVHVTSLSDKASFTASGNCIVCKNSTKQMCMGCMKIYYCSYQCQSLHWATHASFCSQQNTYYGL